MNRKKNPNLISSNDYRRIARSLSNLTPDEFFHTLGNYTIKVSVTPTGKAINVWNQPFIITVYQDNGRVTSIQHFKSVEEMKTILGNCRQRKDD